MSRQFKVETRKRRNQPEQDLQRQLVKALGYLLTPETFFFAVPNGGWRSNTEAAIFQGQGVKAGVPDLIFVSKGQFYGLELKAGGNTLSVAQRDVHDLLRKAGARVETVRTMNEALARLREFGIPLKENIAKQIMRAA